MLLYKSGCQNRSDKYEGTFTDMSGKQQCNAIPEWMLHETKTSHEPVKLKLKDIPEPHIDISQDVVEAHGQGISLISQCYIRPNTVGYKDQTTQR